MARNRFLIIGLIVALVLGCGLISAGSLIYRIGFSNGFGQGAVVASASGGEGAVVPPRAYAPYGYNTWGYQPHTGLSIMPILGLCMVGLFFWLAIGGIFRARMWRHGHRMWGRGPWGFRHGWHDRGPWGFWDDQPGHSAGHSAGQGQPPQEKPSNEATL